MKKKPKAIRKPRTQALFNTGTRPHRSIRDYTRKIKHKEAMTDDGE